MSHIKRFAPLFFIFIFIEITVAQTDYWVSTGGPSHPNVRSLITDAVDKIFAGTSDGGVYVSSNNGATWSQNIIGMSDSVVNALAVSAGGYIFAGTTGSDGLYRSIDSGAGWIPILFDSSGGGRKQVSALCIDAGGQVLAAAEGRIYRSTDNGNHWQSINFNRRNIYTILSTSNWLLFAGTQSGVYRSTDHGDSWENLSSGLEDSTVNSLGVDGIGYLYAGTAGGGLYRSGNNGQNWDRIDSGFVSAFVKSIVINSMDQLFVGTQGAGVYRSTENGEHWTAINSGLTYLNIQSLAINSSGHIFAGTSGGGVFRSTLSTTDVTASSSELPGQMELKQNYPNPFNPTTIVKFSVVKPEHATLKVYDMLGQDVMTLYDGAAEPGHYYRFTVGGANLPSGMYFYRIVTDSRTDVKKMILLR